MEGFKFTLGQATTITASGEKGEVVGRADFKHQEDQYFIRYKAADGRAVESWWTESALTIK